jgi:two-component system, sensor histidine kinase
MPPSFKIFTPPMPQPSSVESETLGSSLPDEVRGNYDYIPATLAGNFAAIILVGFIFAGTAPWMVGIWASVFVLFLGVRFYLGVRYRRTKRETLADWQRWRTYSNMAALGSATLWGLTSWIFFPLAEGSTQNTGLTIVVYTLCIAAMPVLCTQPRIFFAFCLLCFSPMIVQLAKLGGDQGLQLAFIMAIIILLTMVLANNYRQAMQRVIELKLRAGELLSQLRWEKRAADVARRDAEVANRAKTQFFAAASHDLRQPLHALGLFAEALRQKSQDPEVAQLVNSINSSVDALEGLFSELLDITRIDTGGVAVQPQHFAVQEVFRKLRLSFEAAAFEKNLDLRFKTQPHWIYADPVLVERILSNLVSNAIRYTPMGGILVTARRRGSVVWLQVWDTGLGIKDTDKERIFEEFYQVAPMESLSPDQRKGLGLGLSIVKRLTDLMKTTLQLRTRWGQGSVFTLQVPIGRVVESTKPTAQRSKHLGLSLLGRLIVVVEDEPAVIAGLEVLLQAWGASVITLENVAAVREWTSTYHSQSVQPDLILADYRLEPGQTGIDAIRLIRQCIGAQCPAIMITGSTMTQHDQAAQEHNFHLLIKPVLPNKLRAMIAFKLGMQQ